MSVLVLSNPHNPTGRTLPRVELTAIAERYVWVLADDIREPLTLQGATFVAFHEATTQRDAGESS